MVFVTMLPFPSHEVWWRLFLMGFFLHKNSLIKEKISVVNLMRGISHEFGRDYVKEFFCCGNFVFSCILSSTFVFPLWDFFSSVGYFFQLHQTFMNLLICDRFFIFFDQFHFYLIKNDDLLKLYRT